MSVIPFSPEAVNCAYRNGVAEILGYPQTSAFDERNIFYVWLVSEAKQLATGKHLVDLGPGMSAFGPALRQMGMEVTLVDDFGGGGGVDIQRREEALKIILALREKLGVRVEELDFVSRPLPLETGSVDVITCFHSLEHWHHSPKPLFREIVRVLKPGGCLVLGTPNAVNLRKRLAVPLGRTNYGTLEEWYHEGDPLFRGHVREPVVHDLHRLLKWNQLEVIGTWGRNFIARDSIALGFLPKPAVKVLAVTADYVIRVFPTLCSDIHVIGRKPEASKHEPNALRQ